MTTKRAGKKRGKRIRQQLAVIPFRVKSTRYEMIARASLLAIKNGIVTQDHLVNLYVCADLADRIGGNAHIGVHSAAIKRLCDEIHADGYRCNEFTYAALESSAGVLLDFIHEQKNTSIAYHALAAVNELERRAA